MKKFSEIDASKVRTVSEYVERPNGLGGTAFVTFRGSKTTKGYSTKGESYHVSLTMDEHSQIKGR